MFTAHTYTKILTCFIITLPFYAHAQEQSSHAKNHTDLSFNCNALLTLLS
jgi:hypothetical protein